MKTLNEIFVDVFTESEEDPNDPFLLWISEEDIEDIVTTGLDYGYFKKIVQRYAEQAIDRCAETAIVVDSTPFIPSNNYKVDKESILKVKEELK